MAGRHPLKEKNVKMGFVKRLQHVAKAWTKMAEPALIHSNRLQKLWASGYYDFGYTRTHTINLMDRGVSTIVPYMVEGNPKVMVGTLIPSYRPWAYTTQLALNYYINKFNLAENVLIPAAINSMFGPAITKTVPVEYGLYNESDAEYRLSIPCIEVIDFANYIGDPAAKRRSDFILEGDVYRLPTEYAREYFGQFKSGVADYIHPDCKIIRDYSPEEISKPDFDRNVLSLRDYTTFIDLYLYDENTVITIMPEGKKAIKLRELEWEGLPGGPYDMLGYKWLSETPIPIPPAWSWHDVDVSMNLLVDKMKEQAENQKDIVAYSSNAEEDMERVAKAHNMGTVKVDDVDSMKQLSFGGVNPDNFNWVNFIESQFTKQGANPDVMGGRGAQAPTLGQEQIVYMNAARQVNNMFTRFLTFESSVLKKWAWEFWTNPTSYCPVVKEVPGVGSFPEVFSSADRVGDFYDFSFEVIPYSTQRMNPEMKYQKLMQFLTQWVMPTMQIAAAQGSQIDINEINKEAAQYLGLDNFNNWYKTSVPTEADLVNYKMTPMGNDTFGTTEGNQNANLFQQQNRTGGALGVGNNENKPY